MKQVSASLVLAGFLVESLSDEWNVCEMRRKTTDYEARYHRPGTRSLPIPAPDPNLQYSDASNRKFAARQSPHLRKETPVAKLQVTSTSTLALPNNLRISPPSPAQETRRGCRWGLQDPSRNRQVRCAIGAHT